VTSASAATGDDDVKSQPPVYDREKVGFLVLGRENLRRHRRLVIWNCGDLASAKTVGLTMCTEARCGCRAGTQQPELAQESAGIRVLRPTLASLWQQEDNLI
jgi:hypothetical protein